MSCQRMPTEAWRVTGSLLGPDAVTSHEPMTIASPVRDFATSSHRVGPLAPFTSTCNDVPHGSGLAESRANTPVAGSVRVMVPEASGAPFATLDCSGTAG